MADKEHHPESVRDRIYNFYLQRPAQAERFGFGATEQPNRALPGFWEGKTEQGVLSAFASLISAVDEEMPIYRVRGHRGEIEPPAKAPIGC